MEFISSQKEFDEVVSKGIVLVDFFATWCGPCKMLGPVLEDIDKKIGDKVKIVKVDVDELADVASLFHIMSVPTMIIFKDGKIVDQSLGFQPADQIIDNLGRFL